jgi:hypothetical protein
LLDLAPMPYSIDDGPGVRVRKRAVPSVERAGLLPSGCRIVDRFVG